MRPRVFSSPSLPFSQPTLFPPQVEEVCKVNDELLARIKAEQEAARLARRSIDDLKARADAGNTELENKVASLGRQLEDARQAQHVAERDSVAAREAALSQVREADSARRLAEAELRAMQGLGSAAAADRASNYAATAAVQEELARVQMQLATQTKELKARLEQTAKDLAQAQRTAAEEAEVRVRAEARAEDLARELAALTRAPPAGDAGAEPLSEKAAAATLYSSLPGDVRAELLELRLARRLHAAEVERLEAKQDDLQARVKALVRDLGQVQADRNQLLSEAADGEKLRRTAAVAQQRAELLEEELRHTHTRLSKEVSQRSRAETGLASTAIDLKHTEARLKEALREVEKLQRAEETRTSQAGMGGIEWFDPMQSLGSASAGGGASRSMGAYASLLQPEKPFSFGSLSAPPQDTYAAPYMGAQQPAAAAGGRSTFDYMQDARLAEQRAKAAEKREATLLAKLKSVELAASNAPGRPGDAAGVVSLSVHTQLLDLAEQRARDAERRVKELETELVSLRAQLRSAEGLHLAMRSQEVADTLEARLDACLSLAEMLSHQGQGSSSTGGGDDVVAGAGAEAEAPAKADAAAQERDMEALLQRLQQQAEANARQAMAERAQRSLTAQAESQPRAASPRVFKLPPQTPPADDAGRGDGDGDGASAERASLRVAAAAQKPPPVSPKQKTPRRRPGDGVGGMASPTPSSPSKSTAAQSPRSPRMQVGCGHWRGCASFLGATCLRCIYDLVHMSLLPL